MRSVKCGVWEISENKTGTRERLESGRALGVERRDGVPGIFQLVASLWFSAFGPVPRAAVPNRRSRRAGTKTFPLASSATFYLPPNFRQNRNRFTEYINARSRSWYFNCSLKFEFIELRRFQNWLRLRFMEKTIKLWKREMEANFNWTKCRILEMWRHFINYTSLFCEIWNDNRPEAEYEAIVQSEIWMYFEFHPTIIFIHDATYVTLENNDIF